MFVTCVSAETSKRPILLSSLKLGAKSLLPFNKDKYNSVVFSFSFKNVKVSNIINCEALKKAEFIIPGIVSPSAGRVYAKEVSMGSSFIIPLLPE